MIDKPQIFLSARTQWVEPLLQHQPKIEICKDVSSAPEPNRFRIMVDLLQANGQASLDEIKQYLENFDRVVLINCETPNDIIGILREIDHPRLYFLTTGRVNWIPQCLHIKNYENFFAAMRSLYHSDGNQISDSLSPYVEKPFFFDALLGNIKPHREYVYNKIEQHDMKSRFFVKYMRYHFSPLSTVLERNDFDWPSGAEIIPGTDTDAWCTASPVKFRGRDVPMSHLIPVDIYNQTAYSIVTESRTDDTCVFLTEKTAKCLLARRIFVMFGGVGYLAHLKDLGFKTFGTIIDESYDTEADHRLRWARAFHQVEYLLSIPQRDVLDQARPILEHNYRLFTSTDWQQQFAESMLHTLEIPYDQ